MHLHLPLRAPTPTPTYTYTYSYVDLALRVFFRDFLKKSVFCEKFFFAFFCIFSNFFFLHFLKNIFWGYNLLLFLFFDMSLHGILSSKSRSGAQNPMCEFLLEEGGKEGKRGPFRGQNFCGSPSQVDGHGWPRSRVGGGLTRVPGGRAAKKKHHNNHHGIYSVSGKNEKSPKKDRRPVLLLCSSHEGLGRKKITEKGPRSTVLFAV